MTKTKKYVRILKSISPNFWYADKIGDVYGVSEEFSLGYYIDQIGCVDKKDVELIITEKRTAKVGERILIVNAELGTYNNGQIHKVHKYVSASSDNNEHIVTDAGFVFWTSEYEVIVNNEVKNGEADEVERYDTAVETARDAIEELRLAAYAKGFEDARRELTATAPVEKTAQERRDEIVEQAKADINELKNRNFYEVPDADNFYNPLHLYCGVYCKQPKTNCCSIIAWC
ncbi:hypothetical protein CHCC5027_2679 [Bacillus paralicheniformis]|uniref:hypothetical protein n=1 Tax=Bacillus paralicheniformis TaxID=1648923 RepID=UPI0013265DA9|nr:hypothetical protein [Bacillus paralicheniformis]TWJ39200.1 hypothetical protein CHCC5027_2679 [Bacillus paralicheniformis]